MAKKNTIEQSNTDLWIILNIQKTTFVISKQWMSQNIVIVSTDWSEGDKQGEVGKWRMSHWSSMVGEVEWERAGVEATEGCSLMS
jgi:hypothetical protein